MLNTITIPTNDEIRAAIREELTAFFSSNSILPQAETDEIGGIELAEAITGKKRATIYGLVSERKVPHWKQGKQLYFSRRELVEWLKSGKRKTRSEIAVEAENYTNHQKGGVTSTALHRKKLQNR